MITTIGSAHLAKITNQADMDKFVKTLELRSKYLVIKPNWVQAREGTYTDAKVLDMFLTSAKRKAVIVESYTFWRTDKYVAGKGDYFSSNEATLSTGKKHWKHFKKQDKWFLSATGIGEVLKKHKAKYINITNEVWSGNTISAEKIKALVESRYEPVEMIELYSYVPDKLYKLRGSDFISFSKAKRELEYAFTLSTKNLFGLIPDPSRYPKYHGESDKKLSQNILDINKIYRSIFVCHFVIDGVFTASNAQSMQKVKCIRNWGYILGGKNSIEADMIVAKLLQSDASKATINTLEASENVLGKFDKRLISQIPKRFYISYKKKKFPK